MKRTAKTLLSLRNMPRINLKRERERERKIKQKHRSIATSVKKLLKVDVDVMKRQLLAGCSLMTRITQADKFLVFSKEQAFLLYQ